MQKRFTLFLALFLNTTASYTQHYHKAPILTGNSYPSIKHNYQNIDAWGIETIIDLKSCDPELIRDADAIKQYVKELCELIKMKAFGETIVVHFGEDEKIAGYSMVQLIETSLISGHFANITNNIYINIFSCKEYDPYKAAEFTKKFFKGSEYSISVVLRK
jgi:S-adenosylmethionine/arginine decarboxylase-like enzyme